MRRDLIATPASHPVRRVTVTVGDRLSDPEGLWPADVALLTSIPGLEHVDILATEGALEAGYLDRLRLAFVGIEEVAPAEPASPKPLGEGGGEHEREGGPVLVVQAHQQSLVFSYRDREEELEGVARRLKADRRAGRHVRLDRTALVVSRALPYLYVARDVFAGAGVPFQAIDTLPLAAEPYAAALDLVIEFVATGFTRRATTALLRSPHFQFPRSRSRVDFRAGCGARRAAVSRRSRSVDERCW